MGTDLPPGTDWIDTEETYRVHFYQAYCTLGEQPETDTEVMWDWWKVSGEWLLDWLSGGYNMVCFGNGSTPYRRGITEAYLDT